jgi:cytochrome c
MLLPGLAPLAAQEQSTPPPPAPNEKPKPLVIPETEKHKKNPVPSTPQSIESGKNLYSSQCAMCHGAKGEGKGDLVERLKLTVPDLGDPQVQKKRTDGEWFFILSKGHADMPPENRLEPNEKWDMINFMRSLSRGEKGGK